MLDSPYGAKADCQGRLELEGWGEPTRTLVPWRQGFRHPTRNECMGRFAQILFSLATIACGLYEVNNEIKDFTFDFHNSTPFVIFNVTYCLELSCAIAFYYGSRFFYQQQSNWLFEHYKNN